MAYIKSIKFIYQKRKKKSYFLSMFMWRLVGHWVPGCGSHEKAERPENRPLLLRSTTA